MLDGASENRNSLLAYCNETSTAELIPYLPQELSPSQLPARLFFLAAPPRPPPRLQSPRKGSFPPVGPLPGGQPPFPTAPPCPRAPVPTCPRADLLNETNVKFSWWRSATAGALLC